MAENENLLRFLNRNYLATSHLIERLEEIKESVAFEKLEKTVNTLINLLQLQAKKLDHLYTVMGETYSFKGFDNLIGTLEECFTPIQQDLENPNLFLLDYITFADQMRDQSAKMAQLTIDQYYDLDLPENFIYDADIMLPLKSMLENSAKVG